MSAPPRRRPAGFSSGFAYLLRGVAFATANRTLLKWALLPLLVAALVYSKPSGLLGRLLWDLLYVFVVALVLALAYLTFFAVQAILASPLNDLLSERVEALAFGRSPPPFSAARFLRGLATTMLHTAGRFLLYLLVMLPLFLLGHVLPVIGTALFLVAGSAASALFFAYDALDYPMSRREWSFGRKWSAVLANKSLLLGFGSTVVLAGLLPVVAVFVFPAAVVGGTLLFCDLENAGAFGEHGPSR
jgi:CysZ protein